MRLDPEAPQVSPIAIKQLAAVFAMGFVFLSFTLVFWQVLESVSVGQSPSNPRMVIAARSVVRGQIYDRGGRVLVQNVAGHPGQQRFIVSSLAQVIGYNSVRYGQSGLEASYNRYLDGSVGSVVGLPALEGFLQLPTVGDSLTLTIDSHLQQVADAALGQHRGVIIVLDPATGAVLAMVSKPYYDPNTLEADWKQVSIDPGQPLLNRATQALYPPGSVFKLVTAAAALQTSAVTPSTQFTCIGDWVIQGFHISCENPQIPSQLTFQKALDLSANAVYAQVAYHLGAATLERYAHDFGFGQAPRLGLPVTPSTLKSPSATWSGPLIASTGFGQGQLQVTPLELAMITDAIANGGVIMTPYLVDRATSPQGVTVYQHTPTPWRRAISTQTAATLTHMMIDVVSQGSGVRARIPGVDVAGKTGTAQVGGVALPHAIFVCFAPAMQPRVEVVVLVENAGEGANVAAPIARTLLEDALQSHG
ncbi:MAG: penicillin-binding transpeptidase domain-containing protein [Chloroflexi bacterium]|nr:penicillin-binding transpeptidase domain-containing protein [Chloroflexota bacterium]